MRFLTKGEVADLLRVSTRTITDYNSKGLLPTPKKIGRLLLWEETELVNKVMGAVKEVPVAARSVPKKRGRPRKI